MGCSEFLEWYSEYRDGLVSDPTLLGRLRQHLYTCPGCARYDASLRQGVQALREVQEIDPSPDFESRLRAKVAAAAAAPPRAPANPDAARVAAALMLAAAVALLVYEGRRQQARREAGPPAATATSAKALPLVVANPAVPFVTFTDLSVSPFEKGAATPVHVRGDVPLGTWANLPR